MDESALNKPRSIFRYGWLAAIVAFLALSNGCVVNPGYHGPPRHYHYYPHHYDYYFYPSARVYFHFTTGFYYYFDGTIWIKTRILPPHIRIDARHRVRIRVDSGPPHSRYTKHAELYKPRPGYRPAAEADRKERDANRYWYEDYRKKPRRRKP